MYNLCSEKYVHDQLRTYCQVNPCFRFHTSMQVFLRRGLFDIIDMIWAIDRYKLMISNKVDSKKVRYR